MEPDVVQSSVIISDDAKLSRLVAARATDGISSKPEMQYAIAPFVVLGLYLPT